MQGLAKQSRYIMFTTFLFEKLSHLSQFYGTEAEFVQHLMSGEVAIPLLDVLKYQQEYEERKEPKFSESELVSFGNYLLQKHRVTDQRGQRQVTHPELENWKEEQGVSKTNLLPSKFQKHQAVLFLSAHASDDSTLQRSIPAVILSVHFHPSKVKYDVELHLGDNHKSRIYNVDESLLIEDLPPQHQ